LRFFLRLIGNYFRQNRTLAGWRSQIWLSALLAEINPKLIFTCADNNILLARYALENPDIQVIFLQNALRDTIGSIHKSIRLPVYLSLGNIEAKIFKSIGVQCREYRPTGSVKLGLAVAKYNESNEPPFDLCFVSHYRPELFFEGASLLFKKIEQCQRMLFKHLVHYASTNNLSLIVICKTRELYLQDRERKYFTSISQSTPFEFIRSDKGEHEFDSYLKGLASGLIVHPASTLGFELFSVGKKVLFGASAHASLVNDWGISHYFDVLPDLVKLQIDSSDTFNQACDRIRQMPISEYQDITRSPARDIISMPEGEYPHDTVCRLISGYLD
jgi:surface carbohydrate biosynthesis protein